MEGTVSRAGLQGKIPQTWFWALALSLGVHGVVLMLLATHLPRVPVAIDSAPLSVDMEFPPSSLVKGTSSLSESPVVNPLPVSSGQPEVLRPVPVITHGIAVNRRSVPVDTVSAGNAAPPAESAEPRAAENDPGALVWRSLTQAHNLVSNPWAGKTMRNLSSGSQDSVFQSYEAAFGAKVAQVGAVNYPPPDQEGHPLSGSVRLATVLNADGSVMAVELLQSSGQSALDQAAQHIVKMAAPFSPFTEAMRAQTELVRITRTFNFVRAGEPLQSH